MTPTKHGSRKVIWIVAAVVGAIALIGATWAVAARFQSPAQRQAQAAPPAAEAIVVDVTRGDLVENSTAMASAEREGARSTVIPTDSGSSVVTGTGVEKNTKLASGAVVLWVNDRPVFAIKGAFPFFRDFGEGDSGEDVALLQRALGEMGYNISADGSFGSYTADCIRDLYSEVGAKVPTREVAATSSASNSQSGDPKTAAKPKKQVMILRSEFMVISGLPAQVVSVPEVGTTLGDSDTSKLVLSSENIALVASVPGAVAVTLSESLAATASRDSEVIPVEISSVKAPDEKEETASADSKVTFTPTKGKVPDAWVGESDILITMNLSEPQLDVLIIPQRAIAADASGVDSVLLQTADGGFTEVAIEQTGCIAGMCAIADGTDVVEGSKLRVDR